MANEITFDKLPQAVGYLTEQVERIHKIVAALQPQVTTDKHRIVEIDEACQITRKAKPTIYTLARKAYKRGKKLYFYEDELLKWIEEGRKVVHNFFNKKNHKFSNLPSNTPLYLI